jgi:hypothetical protein
MSLYSLGTMLEDPFDTGAGAAPDTLSLTEFMHSLAYVRTAWTLGGWLAGSMITFLVGSGGCLDMSTASLVPPPNTHTSPSCLHECLGMLWPVISTAGYCQSSRAAINDLKLYSRLYSMSTLWCTRVASLPVYTHAYIVLFKHSSPCILRASNPRH